MDRHTRTFLFSDADVCSDEAIDRGSGKCDRYLSCNGDAYVSKKNKKIASRRMLAVVKRQHKCQLCAFR
jgi:hypothetical protein